MECITTIYHGNYKCTTLTPHSEIPIITKATKFTPLDLLISSYGSCLLATIDYEARKKQFQITNMRSEASYKMSDDGLQLGSVFVSFFFNEDYTEDQKWIIKDAVDHHCHVSKSLNPDIKKDFEYIFNAK